MVVVYDVNKQRKYMNLANVYSSIRLVIRYAMSALTYCNWLLENQQQNQKFYRRILYTNEFRYRNIG